MNIILTGATGYLGRYLIRFLPDNHRLLAIGNSQLLAGDGSRLTILQQDLKQNDFAEWQKFEPEVIIHAAARSRFHDCQNDLAATHKMNVAVTEKIARFAGEHGAHLIFTSTDQVYCGEQELSREDGEIGPRNVYAESKVAAEQVIIDTLPQTTILRCALMYGTSLNNNPVFTDLMKQKLLAGENLDLFVDEWRSPAWVADMARTIWRLAEIRPAGIFNAGGPKRLSRYQMGQIMCRVLGISENRLHSGSLANHPLAPLRAADCSMDCSKLQTLLGQSFLPMEEAFGHDTDG